MKIIRLTEKQLREVYDDDFEYVSDDTMPQYDGNTHIYSAGKIDDKEHGEPKYTDELDVMAPQGYWYGGHYRNSRIHESNDVDNDGIEDFYDNLTNNTLDDGDDSNNISVVPNTVLQKVDILLNTIKQANLNTRQQYMVAAKIMDELNLEKLPPSWSKNLALHVKSKK